MKEKQLPHIKLEINNKSKDYTLDTQAVRYLTLMRKFYLVII